MSGAVRMTRITRREALPLAHAEAVLLEFDVNLLLSIVMGMIDGKPLIGAYSAFRSGHALNNRLLRELLAHPEAYEVVSFDDERRAPRGLAQLAPAW